MRHRNPRYNHSGGVDCEISLPGLGWVPCSTHAADPDTKDLYAEIMLEGNIKNDEHDKDSLVGMTKKLVHSYAVAKLAKASFSWAGAETLRALWPALNQDKATKGMLYAKAVIDYAEQEIKGLSDLSYADLMGYTIDAKGWPSMEG